MKFNMKFKFQGPPSFALHHFTAFAESDSNINVEFLMAGEDIESLMARNIAYTSAELISKGGMGHEKRQMKEPESSRRTPPTALRLQEGSKDASIFHFKTA